MTAQLQVETGRDARPATMSQAEWDARIELAACYRIFNRLGWVELR
jgi:hypothetical protein